MTTPFTLRLADQLLAHAQKHYEDGGWDVVVECWSREQVAELLHRQKRRTLNGAVDAFAPLVDVWADRQADARNSAF